MDLMNELIEVAELCKLQAEAYDRLATAIKNLDLAEVQRLRVEISRTDAVLSERFDV